jgi:ketosteroid isomerase-like protein
MWSAWTVALALLAMPDRTPPATLGEMVDAVNASDAARYARVYAPDALITIHGGTELRGRAAIEAYEVELLRQFPGTRLALFAVWEAGPWTVAHYGVRSPQPTLTGHEGLLFYRFAEDGLIAEERRYLDTLTPMSQVGALGKVRAPVPELPARPSSFEPGDARERANAELVRRALGAADETTFLAHVDPAARFREVSWGWPAAAATPAVWFESWRTVVADPALDISTVATSGAHVLVEAVLRGRLKAPLGVARPSERTFTVHRAYVVQVENGRITSLTAFMNGKELAESVGQWPPARP